MIITSGLGPGDVGRCVKWSNGCEKAYGHIKRWCSDKIWVEFNGPKKKAICCDPSELHFFSDSQNEKYEAWTAALENAGHELYVSDDPDEDQNPWFAYYMMLGGGDVHGAVCVKCEKKFDAHTFDENFIEPCRGIHEKISTLEKRIERQENDLIEDRQALSELRRELSSAGVSNNCPHRKLKHVDQTVLEEALKDVDTLTEHNSLPDDAHLRKLANENDFVGDNIVHLLIFSCIVVREILHRKESGDTP